MTPTEIVRAYNALRERCLHLQECGIGNSHDDRCDCDDCVAFGVIAEAAALPPLPVADVPEVGSIVVDTSTPLRTRHVVQQVIPARVWIGPEDKTYAQEHHEWPLDAAWCVRFRPAPEAGE